MAERDSAGVSNRKGEAMAGEGRKPESDATRKELPKTSAPPAAAKVVASGIGSAAIVAALIFARRSTKPDPAVRED